MSISFPIYGPEFLYRVMYDNTQAVPSTYWLDLCFGGSYVSPTPNILFEKIGSTRKIAPFVMPQQPGRPTYKRQGSNLVQFTPAYVKPKDAVNPSEHLYRQPGELVGAAKSPMERFNNEVARITAFHRDIIQRRWEWLAAKAIIDGKVTISGDAYPAVLVDFQRDAGQTIVLTGTARWGQSGISIYGTLQDWMNLMAKAQFGGVPNRMTMGTDVWSVVQKDAEIIAHMKTDQRGDTKTVVQQGLIRPLSVQEPARYVGTLNGMLDLYVYYDYYVDDAGVQQPFMGSKEVVLSCPNVEGWKTFGAIQDIAGQLQPTDIFTKMYDQEDPSARFILSQSAPLMIPVNPNCTLKATVL